MFLANVKGAWLYPDEMDLEGLVHIAQMSEIRPQPDGPLAVTGNLEICTGTGRTVDRVTSARLCRCGGSANKPFCDGTHARIGFRST